jgi:hypothetical protein
MQPDRMCLGPRAGERDQILGPVPSKSRFQPRTDQAAAIQSGFEWVDRINKVDSFEATVQYL